MSPSRLTRRPRPHTTTPAARPGLHGALEHRRVFGFTLVELIVVIVVLGILAALLVPSFRAVTSRTENQKAALELSAVLRQATALAALEGLDVNAAHLAAAVGDMSGSAPEASDEPAGRGRGRGLRLLEANEASTVYGDVSWGINQDRRQVTVAMKSVPGMCVAAQATTNAQGAALGVATAVLSDRIDCDAASDEVADGEFTEGMPSSPSGPIVLDPNVETIEGPGFACEYTVAAQIHCYGRNYYGQTGQPASSSTTTIVYIPGITVTEAAAGYTHVAAITTDRRVVIWGTPGGDAEATTPVPGSHTVRELTLPSGVTPVTVSAGRDMTAVVGSDRIIYIYGPDSTGSPTGFDTIQLPPSVVDVTQVVAVECGANFICVLLDDGTVWCAGYNDHGQLGDGSAIRTDAPADSFVQVTTGPSSPLTGGLELTLGRHHAQVRTAALVHAWGKADAGAIGDGQTSADRNRAVQVCDTDVAGGCATGPLTSAARLFPAGPDHTCAILTDGTYACTGTYGDPETTTDIYTVVAQLPYRYAPAFDAPVRPTPPAGGGGDEGDGELAAPSDVTVGDGPASGTLLVAFSRGTNPPGTVFTAICTSPSGVPGTASGTSSPILVSGLTPGVTYSCTVSASNGTATTDPVAGPPVSTNTPVLVVDDFNRPNGAFDTGDVDWVDVTGGWTIASNQLRAAASGERIAVVDVGSPQQVVRATVGSSSGGVVFRYENEQNYYYTGHTTNAFRIYRVLDGATTSTVVASGSFAAADNRFFVDGDQWQWLRNGQVLASGQLAPGGPMGNFAGLRAGASTSAMSFDDFLAGDLATVPPQVPTGVSFASVSYPATVTWNPVPDLHVGSYRVIRNGQVIATLPASTTSYTDATSPQGTSVNYRVAAVSTYGVSSTLSALTPTVPVGDPTVTVASDTFTRANTCEGLGTAPTGQSWIRWTGTVCISSNSARGAASTRSAVVLDLNATDQTATIPLAQSTGVVIRGAGPGDYVSVRRNDTRLTLEEVVGGTTVRTFNSGTFSMGTSPVLRVEVEGGVVRGYVNDTLRLSTTLEHRHDGTMVGMFFNSNSSAPSIGTFSASAFE